MRPKVCLMYNSIRGFRGYEQRPGSTKLRNSEANQHGGGCLQDSLEYSPFAILKEPLRFARETVSLFFGHLCGSGEIGRHTILRGWRRKAWGFKSPLPHHRSPRGGQRYDGNFRKQGSCPVSSGASCDES